MSEKSLAIEFHPKTVGKLAAVGGERTVYRDTGEKGLTLRVSSNGTRVYGLVYFFEGRSRRFTIGSVEDVSVADARKRAYRLKGEIANGHDPQAAKAKRREEDRKRKEEDRAKANRLTFKGLAEKFMKKADLRSTTRKGWDRYLAKEILPAVGSLAVEEVTRADVRKIVEKIEDRGSKVSARRAFEIVRRVFSWAKSKELVSVSPCDGLDLSEMATAKERERVYTNDELRAIFEASKGTEIEDLLALIARTATRSHETRAARWKDIDLERGVWTIPAGVKKSDRDQKVPLSEGATKLLKALEDKADSPWVFPAPTGPCDTCGERGHMDKPNKVVREVALAVGMLKAEVTPEEEKKARREKRKPKPKWIGEPVRLHDVRRTAADRIRSDLHVPPHVVDFGILGHTPPKLLRIYMPSGGASFAEIKTALERWNERLAEILRGETQKGKLLEMGKRS